MSSYHRKKKQIPIIGYVRVFKEYLYKSKIWQSETSPNQGIPNQVPCLGLLWVFLNTLKYPKMEICYFFPVYKEVSGAPLWTQKQHIFGQ